MAPNTENLPPRHQKEQQDAGDTDGADGDGSKKSRRRRNKEAKEEKSEAAATLTPDQLMQKALELRDKLKQEKKKKKKGDDEQKAVLRVEEVFSAPSVFWLVFFGFMLGAIARSGFFFEVAAGVVVCYVIHLCQFRDSSEHCAPQMMMRLAGSDGEYDLEALLPALAKVLDSDSSVSDEDDEPNDDAEIAEQRPAFVSSSWLSDSGAFYHMVPKALRPKGVMRKFKCAGADGKFIAEGNGKTLFHGNAYVGSDQRIAARGWTKVHGSSKAGWYRLSDDQQARVENVLSECSDQRFVRLDTSRGVTAFEDDHAPLLLGREYRSDANGDGHSFIRRWAWLFVGAIVAGLCDVPMPMLPVYQGPVPLNEAEHVVYARASTTTTHLLNGHYPHDPNCSGCQWFTATAGRKAHGLDRTAFLIEDERFFVGDVYDRGDFSHNNKRYTTGWIEVLTGVANVAHTRRKNVQGMKVALSRLIKKYRLDVRRVDGSLQSFVVSFDRERSLMTEACEALLADYLGRLRSVPAHSSTAIGERLMRTLKEMEGSATSYAAISPKYWDIVEATALAQRNFSKDFTPRDNEVLQNGFEFVIGEAVRCVLPPKALDLLKIRKKVRSLHATILGLDEYSRRGLWLEVSLPDGNVTVTTVDYRSVRQFNPKWYTYGWRAIGGNVFRAPEGHPHIDPPSESSSGSLSSSSSVSSSSSSSSSSSADDQHAVLEEESSEDGEFDSVWLDLPVGSPMLQALAEQFASIPVTKSNEQMYKDLDWDGAFVAEVERQFRDYSVLKFPTRREIVIKIAGVHIGQLVAIRIVKDGEPRVRIVFNAPNTKDGDGKVLDFANSPKIQRVKEEFRRLPTCHWQIRVVLVFGSIRGYEVVCFDISGAYLWTKLPEDMRTFVDCPRAIRRAIHTVLGWTEALNPNMLCEMVGGVYGHPIVGDLWADLSFKALTNNGWTCVEDSFYVFEEEPDDCGNVEMVGTCVLYVDDGAATAPEPQLNALSTLLNDLFEIKQWMSVCSETVGERMLAVYYRIRSEVVGDVIYGTIFEDTSEYNKKTLQKVKQCVDEVLAGDAEDTGVRGNSVLSNFSIRKARTPSLAEPPSAPLDVGPLAPYAKSLNGSFLYGVSTDGDLAYAVQERSRHAGVEAGNPAVHSSWDSKMILRMAGYLEGRITLQKVSFTDSRDWGLLEMLVWTDADHAGCLRTRRSTDGVVIQLVGPHGTKVTLRVRSKVQSSNSLSTAQSELGGTLRGAYDLFEVLPIIERVFAVRVVRFLCDASAAIAAVKHGYSKKMKYLRCSKHFEVNLAWLHETISKFIEKCSTSFQAADPLTKPLPFSSFGFHRRFSLMIQSPKQFRCTCLCACTTGAVGAMKTRCVKLTNHPSALCRMCRGSECRCACWGGCSYDDAKFSSGSESSGSESDAQHSQMQIIARRVRRKKKKGGCFNLYGSEGPGDRKRRADDSPLAYPAIVAPVVPAAYPAPVAPLIPGLYGHAASAADLQRTAQLEASRQVMKTRVRSRFLRSIFGVFVFVLKKEKQLHSKILTFLQDNQVRLPIENAQEAQTILQLICAKGSKGRMTFVDIEFLTDNLVKKENASHFAQGHFRVGSVPFISNGMKLVELLNFAWQRQVLKDADLSSDSDGPGSFNSSENPGMAWEVHGDPSIDDGPQSSAECASCGVRFPRAELDRCRECRAQYCHRGGCDSGFPNMCLQCHDDEEEDEACRAEAARRRRR